MAKLINILAASVGGGLMLGAGIRLGEALVGREPAGPRAPAADEGKLAARLGALEERLRHMEVSSTGPPVAKQDSEFEAIRSQLRVGEQEIEARIEALGEISLRLRGELQGWLEQSVAERMAEVESKLRTESERGQQQMLDAFAESVQSRVMQRIARLEEEVAGQSAAMIELRECSLRTEQGMQKLLGGIDRLIVSRESAPTEKAEVPMSQETAATEPPAPAAESKPAAEPAPAFAAATRSRRWNLFG